MIILYDIPSTLPHKTISTNVIKTRYSLNFKGIPHQTEWVEFPDIEAVCKKLGAKPTSKQLDGTPLFTLPVIHDTSTGAIVSESAQIAEYLDATYPDTPRLFPPGTAPLQYAFIDAVLIKLKSFYPFAILQSNSLLNPVSEVDYRRKMEIAFKVDKLEDIVPEGDKEREWLSARAGFEKVGEWYEKGKEEGQYLLGNTACFADFVFASLVSAPKRIWGEDSDQVRDFRTWSGGKLAAFVESLEKYETVM